MPNQSLDQSMEYQSKTVLNPHILVWNVRKRLSNGLHLFLSKDWSLLNEADDGGWFKKICRWFSGGGENRYFKTEREEQKRLAPLVSALFAINGVEKVSVGQYDFSVEKGELFSWDEIVPVVEEVLDAYLASID